jgi:hypothetical protein
MGRQYGYSEDYARKVGKFRICTSCDAVLTKNNKLHISPSQILLLSGRVKTVRVPAADKE